MKAKDGWKTFEAHSRALEVFTALSAIVYFSLALVGDGLWVPFSLGWLCLVLSFFHLGFAFTQYYRIRQAFTLANMFFQSVLVVIYWGKYQFTGSGTSSFFVGMLSQIWIFLSIQADTINSRGKTWK